MMRFQIKRVWVGDKGCFGVIFCDRQPPFALTLERTFDPDDRVVVPYGISKCTFDFYHKGGYPTYEIQFPDGSHDRVLFHKGNKEHHSRGCILIGEYFHDFGDLSGIANSKAGFNEFMSKAMENGKPVKEFELEVT